MKLNETMKYIGMATVFFLLAVASHFAYDFLNANPSDSRENKSCNLARINIRGVLQPYTIVDKDSPDKEDITSADDVMEQLEKAELNDEIKAIIIEVDSRGGTGVVGEEIASVIKSSKKPIVAYIRTVGASASYEAISTAERIFASKDSEVGSIGVTSSYLENTNKNKKDGYSFVQLSMGRYKDSGSPDKQLTEEERLLFMRDIKIMYDNFVKEIAVNRNIPIEKVRSFADGSTMLGERAKQLGLVDEIGGYEEAKKYVEAKTGIKLEACQR